MELDAKIARDESVSEEEDESEEEQDSDQETKNIAAGQDLDLPSEDSGQSDDEDLKGEDTDDDLEEYYAELGIQDEKMSQLKERRRKAFTEPSRSKPRELKMEQRMLLQLKARK